MLNCKTSSAFSVAAPNLVLLRVITPYARVPSFRNLGSLVAATILIDDIFLSDDISVSDAYDETTDDDNWSRSSEHVTDQEDGEEIADDDDGDSNTNNGLEHISDQEDCDETTDADDDNSNYGSERIFDQESCDETTDGHDNSNHGSEHIIDQDETADDDDDNSNCGSEHIVDHEGCDENTDGNNCSYVSEHMIDQEDRDETTDDEGHDNEDTDKRENYKIDDVFGYTSEGDDFEANIDEEDGSDSSANYKIGYGRGGQKDNYSHDSNIDSDGNTYEYSEIAGEAVFDYHSYGKNSSKDAKYDNNEINASEYLGGQNILQSLSNVTTLGLLTDAGEVVLSRELKRCPTFSNLKTLSLGEWCMAADFNAVIFLLQHSPNIESLFLQLKLSFDNRSRKAFETGIKLKGRSFTCKDLQIVKIECSKDDRRVHKLANLFIANGIPLEKILVRRTGSAYLRAQELADQAMHELMLFGRKLIHTKVIRFLERSSLVDVIRL